MREVRVVRVKIGSNYLNLINIKGKLRLATVSLFIFEVFAPLHLLPHSPHSLLKSCCLHEFRHNLFLPREDAW